MLIAVWPLGLTIAAVVSHGPHAPNTSLSAPIAIAQPPIASTQPKASRRWPAEIMKISVNSASGTVTALSPKSVTKFQGTGKSVVAPEAQAAGARTSGSAIIAANSAISAALKRGRSTASRLVRKCASSSIEHNTTATFGAAKACPSMAL